jgi:hypothetical protein
MAQPDWFIRKFGEAEGPERYKKYCREWARKKRREWTAFRRQWMVERGYLKDDAFLPSNELKNRKINANLTPIERELRRMFIKERREERLRKWAEHAKQRRERFNNARLTLPRKYTAYKNGAIERGVSFNLSFEEFESFYGISCFYCGVQFSVIGLDRVDNGRGYEMGNIVSCCAWVQPNEVE